MRRFFGASSLVAVGNVLAAALQFFLLSAASKIGGLDAVGAVSLAMAAASALSIFLTSDCKSISLTTFSSGSSIWPAVVLVIFGTLVGMMVGGASWAFDFSALFFPLLIFKILQAWGDMAAGLWLVEKKVIFLFYSAIIKPVVLCFVLMIAPNFFSGNISVVAWALVVVAFLLVGFELILFFLRISAIGRLDLINIPREVWGKVFGRFGLLALTGLITYSPQFIIRDIADASFGVAEVGLFSIHYQILLVATPVVSAFSQVVLGKKDLCVKFAIRSGVAALFVGVVSVLIGVFCIYFIPIDVIRMVFQGFSPLPGYSILALSLFAILMYACVYLGFLSVKLNVPRIQLYSSVFFVGSLVVCWIYRFSWFSLSWLLFVIVVSLLCRVIILSIGVSGPLCALPRQRSPQ